MQQQIATRSPLRQTLTSVGVFYAVIAPVFFLAYTLLNLFS